MTENDLIPFILQITPFVILIAFSLLNYWDAMWFNGVVEEYTADSAERLAPEIFDTLNINPNDEQFADVCQNESIQHIIKQVTIATGDRVYLPATVVGLTVSGSALLFVELITIQSDTRVIIFNISLPPTYHIFGLVLYVYISILWLFAIITVVSFTRIHPGEYFDKAYNNPGDYPLIGGDSSLEDRFRVAARTWLVPVFYTITLLIIIVFHFGL